MHPGSVPGPLLLALPPPPLPLVVWLWLPWAVPFSCPLPMCSTMTAVCMWSAGATDQNVVAEGKAHRSCHLGWLSLPQPTHLRPIPVLHSLEDSFDSPTQVEPPLGSCHSRIQALAHSRGGFFFQVILLQFSSKLSEDRSQAPLCYFPPQSLALCLTLQRGCSTPVSWWDWLWRCLRGNDLKSFSWDSPGFSLCYCHNQQQQHRTCKSILL